MSKSRRGSQENQGKIVEQKSGLNGETRGKSLPSGPSESEGSQEMAETPAVLFHESPGPPAPEDRSRRYTRILVILFLCTLPLVNPIVHGDGVGYYAYVRGPLIEHNFRLHTRLSRRESHNLALRCHRNASPSTRAVSWLPGATGYPVRDLELSP